MAPSGQPVLLAKLWYAGSGVALGVAWLLPWWLMACPNWPAAGAGWGVVALNSLLARWLNKQAVGAGPKAFMGWGIIANAIRMLTLVIIFAYITLSFEDARGSFLVSGLAAFFVMMPFEVAQLFWLQPKQ